MDISYRITNSLHGSVSSVAACCHRGPFVLWTSGVGYCAVQRCLWHSADRLDWNPEWNRPLLETLPLRTWKRRKNRNTWRNCLAVRTMGTERMTNSIASSPEMLEFRRILHRPMDYCSWGLDVQSTVVPDTWTLAMSALSSTQELRDDKKEGCESWGVWLWPDFHKFRS